jgi:leader peptidase (prepilin peptidase)/N-methyltransferase
MYIITTAIFALYGLLIGSFLNVCIYRLPRHQKIGNDRSHCADCGHILAPADLIPVISYLMLGRRCRYCRQPISARYAVVEITTMLIYGATAWLIRPDGLNLLLLRTILLVLFASALLVWAFIRADRNSPPRLLYLFLFIPAGALIFWHRQPALPLFGMLTIIMANLLLLALRLWQPNVKKPGHEMLGLCAVGLVLSWPGVMVLVLAETIVLAAMNIWRNLRHRSAKEPGSLLALIFAGFSVVFIGLGLLSVPWFY